MEQPTNTTDTKGHKEIVPEGMFSTTDARMSGYLTFSSHLGPTFFHHGSRA